MSDDEPRTLTVRLAGAAWWHIIRILEGERPPDENLARIIAMQLWDRDD